MPRINATRAEYAASRAKARAAGRATQGTAPMTDTQRRRVIDALAETQALLVKEMAYLPHLRHQSRIEFYEGHIATLAAMLEG